MTSTAYLSRDPVEHCGVRFAGPDRIAQLVEVPHHGSRKIEVELAALDVPHAEAVRCFSRDA